MEGILLICLLLMVIIVRSQSPDNFIFFTGYVFDEDSLPVENAFLINFRTLKPVATNKNGYFQTFLIEGDSLLINHISYERRIVKSNRLPSKDNRFYLRISPYEIRTVTINYRERINLKNNMNEIYSEMRAGTPNYMTGTEYNVYAPPRKGEVAGINVVELINWIKTERYRKGKTKQK